MTAPGRTAERLYEVRDGSGTVHDFWGDDGVNSHRPEDCRACELARLRAAEAPLRERVRVLESLLATAVHYHEYAPGVVHVASCETSVGKPCDCWMPAARAALKEPPRG